MATPNYSFEKRRRELDKKAKKDEKRRQKLAAKKADGNAETPTVPQANPTDAVPPAGDPPA